MLVCYDALTSFFTFFFFVSRSGGGAAKKFAVQKKVTGKNQVKGKPILDARNKIIQKNRAKMHDARDKLVQIAKRSGDARLKLLKKNINSLKKFGEPVPTLNTAAKRNPVALKTQKRPVAPPKRAKFQRAPPSAEMDIEMEYFPTSTSLRRTVQNEIAYTPASSMPPLPTFKYMESSRRMTAPLRATSEYEVDPFDCYEVPVARPYDVSEPRNLNRSVHEAHMDAYPRKGILRSTGGNGISSMSYERSLPMPSSQYRSGANALSAKRFVADENSHLSHEMRARLQRAPDSNQSAGIFSNPYASDPRDARQAYSNPGYRIVVSNLHGSVSQSDIKVRSF